MNGGSFVHRLLLLCLSILLAALALRWAVRIFEDIWPQLAIGAGVALVLAGVVELARRRRDHW